MSSRAATAHEPGELENTAMAVFGPGWRDQVHRVTNNHACIGVFTKPDGGGTVFNAGVTDWAYALESGRPGGLTRHRERPHPAVDVALVQFRPLRSPRSDRT